jgi:hypothetical protein
MGLNCTFVMPSLPQTVLHDLGQRKSEVVPSTAFLVMQVKAAGRATKVTLSASKGSEADAIQ